ncbi:MAG: glycosyltransferase [Deltaproteobacteria bacterium]|nr:glycosyltransferase [Deltaproteobacteria bacterium]MBN2670115.1 glycosyltransferase [Deltaproteobacteria bacterium]
MKAVYLKKYGISLVVIVKNEAERIFDFLSHHKPLVKEMIVLDTGSTDNTVALAESAGAAVHHFTWCDDFSAARNAAALLAKNKWILCIDADERIAARDFNAVRRATQHKDCVYVMPQRNYYDNPQHPEWVPVDGEYPVEEGAHSGYFKAFNTKFYARRKELKFEGRVHESLVSSAKKLNLPIVKLNIPIHHYGYVISDAHNNDRDTRYGKLLKQKMTEHPNNIQAMEEYATHLVQVKSIDEALPILETLDDQPNTNSNITRARILLGTIRVAKNDIQGAAAVFQRAIVNDPESIFPYVELLKLLAGQRQFDQMKEVLDTALNKFGEAPQLLREQSRYLIETRQIHQAAKVTRKVAERYPSIPEYAHLADKCEALSKKVREMETQP